jgi:hypothetical protein
MSNVLSANALFITRSKFMIACPSGSCKKGFHVFGNGLTTKFSEEQPNRMESRGIDRCSGCEYQDAVVNITDETTRVHRFPKSLPNRKN